MMPLIKQPCNSPNYQVLCSTALLEVCVCVFIFIFFLLLSQGVAGSGRGGLEVGARSHSRPFCATSSRPALALGGQSSSPALCGVLENQHGAVPPFAFGLTPAWG